MKVYWRFEISKSKLIPLTMFCLRGIKGLEALLVRIALDLSKPDRLQHLQVAPDTAHQLCHNSDTSAFSLAPPAEDSGGKGCFPCDAVGCPRELCLLEWLMTNPNATPPSRKWNNPTNVACNGCQEETEENIHALIPGVHHIENV